MSELSVALLRAAALIHRLEEHGLLEGRVWKVVSEAHSPWISVDVVAAIAFDDDRVRPLRFAIWRETAAVYVVGCDGAVGDDPIDLDSVPL